MNSLNQNILAAGSRVKPQVYTGCRRIENRSPLIKGDLLPHPIIFCCISLIFFLFLLTYPLFASVPFSGNTLIASENKTFFNKDNKEEAFTFTLGAKIIKGACIRQKEKTWIDGFLVKKLFESMGNEASFDPETRLLALGGVKADLSRVRLSMDGGETATIVINGNIFKSGCIKSGNKIFLPLHSIRVIVESTGRVLNIDNSSNLAAVSSDNSPGKPVNIKPSPAISSTPAPLPSATPAFSSAGEKKEAVEKYLNSLKKILEENRPGEKEKKKFGGDMLETKEGKLSSNDFREIAEKQKKILEGIKNLSPPDSDTGEVHKLALSITARMIRITELASKIIGMPEGNSNPDAERDIVMLLKQVERDEQEFDKKVMLLRKRYGLEK